MSNPSRTVGTMLTMASADISHQRIPMAVAMPAMVTGIVLAFSNARRDAKKYSFQEKMKRRMPVAASPGTESGRTMRQNVVSQLAPSTSDDSSSSRGRALKKSRMIQMAK